MMRCVRLLLLVMMAGVLSSGVVSAEVSFKYKHKFVGAKSCKKCHKSKKKGKQYAILKDSRHAKAYKTLGGRNAKKYAKERGISNPQKSKECLICHVTAFKAKKKMLGKKFSKKEGVSCERCHGPGKSYSKKKTMKKIAKEMAKKGKSKTAKKKGLRHPTEEVCLECHVETITVKGKKYTNPAYTEPFDFKKSMEKIKHFNPKKKRAKT